MARKRNSKGRFIKSGGKSRRKSAPKRRRKTARRGAVAGALSMIGL